MGTCPLMGCLTHGGMCPGASQQPWFCQQSKVLPARMSLGVVLGAMFPLPQEGIWHLTAQAPKFNEPQEGLHGLSICPWSFCQSSPALAPALLGKQPSRCVSLPAFLPAPS